MSSRERTLDGHRVLVIGGGGSGIGREISRAVHASGGKVAVVDIDAERANETVAELGGPEGGAIAVNADVRSVTAIDQAVASTVEAFGGLDVLITVVGGQAEFGPQWLPITETTDETFDLIMDMNLRYVFRAVRSTLRVFAVQESGGVIVSVGSLAGVVSAPNAVVYGVAKAGLMNLARTVSAEYGRHGIRMNTVSCGVILTPVAARNRAENIAARLPLQRAGTPEEVAASVVFLASPQSAYVSGQNLTIDGGATVKAPMPAPGAHPSAAS